MATTKPRMTITFSDEIKAYLESKSSEMGITIASVVNVIISEHMKQEKVIKSLDDIMVMYKEKQKGKE